ncbi:Uncharacterised protein [Mycobacteroides abscessus subsp. massiliense]|nr:Uncharacterised protein [Mycobacteroides abscessus subsp. massiliense]
MTTVERTFAIGLGSDDLRHAVSSNEVPHMVSPELAARAQAVCGMSVKVIGAWEHFRPGSRFLSRNRCVHCGWILAIHGAASMQQEIASYAGAAEDRPAFAAAGIDPGLLRRLFEAILAEYDGDCQDEEPGPGQLSSLLAHAGRHTPVVLTCEECAEPDGQDVANAVDRQHRCSSIVCMACTLTAGSWAGEWEGQIRSECTVAWPCSVIGVLARSYKLNVVSPWLDPVEDIADSVQPSGSRLDGKWHRRTMHFRADADGTTFAIEPSPDHKGRYTLTLQHQIGLKATSRHDDVQDAKRHAENIISSMTAPYSNRAEARADAEENR